MTGARSAALTALISVMAAIMAAGFSVYASQAPYGHKYVLAVVALLCSLLLLFLLRSGTFNDGNPVLHDAAAVAILIGLAGITFSAVRVSLFMANREIPIIRQLSFAAAADLFLLAGTVAIVPAILHRVDRFKAVPTEWLLGAMILLAGSLLSSFKEHNLIRSLFALVAFHSSFIAVPVVILYCATNRMRLLLFLNVWILFVGVNCLVGLTDFLGLSSLGLMVMEDWSKERVAGLTPHPNHLGLVGAMVLPVGLTRAITGRGLAVKVPSACLAALCAFGVLVSGSRAALIAGLLGIVVLIVLSRKRSALLIASVLVAVAIYAIIGVYSGRTNRSFAVAYNRIFDQVQESDSNRAHLQAVKESIAGWREDPILGRGYTYIRDALNIYSQFLEAGGIVALAGFALFVISIFRMLYWTAVNSDMDPELRFLMLSLFVSVSVWLLYGIVQNSISDRFIYVPIGFMFAIRELVRHADGESPGLASR